MDQVLHVDHVSYSWPEGKGVHGVSLQLAAGEVLGVIGRSGSGKSTLLKLVAGLLQPEQGTIGFKGDTVAGPADRLVAGHELIRLAAQDPDLLPNHTVAENLERALRKYDGDYAQARFAYLAERCQLEDILHKKPDQLSGGERQLTGLAVALSDEPELLLLDEPFNHMDKPVREQFIIDLPEMLQENNTAAILVSHNIVEVLALSHRLMVLQQGKVVQEGHPQEVFYRPANGEVARLVGMRNILSRDQAVALEWGDKPMAFHAEDLEIKISLWVTKDTLVRRTWLHGHRWLVELERAGVVLYAMASQDLPPGTKVGVQLPPPSV